MAGTSKRRKSVPTLRTLIGTTTKLRRSLEELLKRHPEERLDGSVRIFVRLLNPVWRNPFGTPYRPDQTKALEAVAWIDRFQQYLQDLEGWIANVMLRRELFKDLPLNYYIHYSAGECLRRLRLQELALKRILEEEESSSTTRPGNVDLRVLLRSLQLLVNRLGVGDCARQSGVSRDTIKDLLAGQIANPHKSTVDKLEKFAKAAVLEK